VLAFLSQAHVEPDITMEIFFVDGPLKGFGVVEITHPDPNAPTLRTQEGAPRRMAAA